MKLQCDLQSYAVQCMYHYSESFLYIEKRGLFYSEICLTYTAVKSLLTSNLAIGTVEHGENIDRAFRRKIKIVEGIKS